MAKYRIVEFNSGNIGIQRIYFFGLFVSGYVSETALRKHSSTPYHWNSLDAIENQCQIDPERIEAAKKYVEYLNTSELQRRGILIKRVIND